MRHPAYPAYQPPSRSAVAVDGGHASLVLAAAAGDQDAWSALVQRFAGLVWDIAHTHGLPTAQATSVARVTWLRLAQRLGRLPHPAHVGEWLAATAHQESVRALRLVSRHDTPEGDHHE
ncbi:MAG: RNA polymerase sigma factor [Egibacteraceae bacterium]